MAEESGVKVSPNGDIIIPSSMVGKLFEALLSCRSIAQDTLKVAVSPDQSNSTDTQDTNRNCGQLKKKTTESMPIIVVPTVEELATNTVVDIKCPFEGCDKVLVNSGALQMHVSKVHAKCGSELISDSISGQFGFNFENDLMKKDRRQVFFCPVANCSRNQTSKNYFTRKSFLKLHYRRQHMERKYQCESCSVKFAVDHDLKKHLKSCGTLHFCECGASYAARQALVTHAKRRGHTVLERSQTSTAMKIVRKSDQSSEKRQDEDNRAAKTTSSHYSLNQNASVVQSSSSEQNFFENYPRKVPDSNDLSFESECTEGCDVSCSPISEPREFNLIETSKLKSNYVNNASNGCNNSVHELNSSTVVLEGNLNHVNAATCSNSSPQHSTYYVNFGETQTDGSFVSSPFGQGTQTIPFTASLMRQSSEKCSSNLYSLSNPAADTSLHATGIQTSFSINPRGKRNVPQRSTKKCSSVQTVEGNKSKKDLSSISVQTDIPKKRKRRLHSQTAVEAESQTTPSFKKAISSCNVDMQTSFPSTTSSFADLSGTADAPNYIFDTEQNAGKQAQCSFIQTETQTLPFDISEFFANCDVRSETSFSQEFVSPQYRETSLSSNVSNFSPTYGRDFFDEVAAGTQTCWAEFPSSFQSPNGIDGNWFESQSYQNVTLSEGTQTADFLDDFTSIEFSDF